MATQTSRRSLSIQKTSKQTNPACNFRYSSCHHRSFSGYVSLWHTQTLSSHPTTAMKICYPSQTVKDPWRQVTLKLGSLLLPYLARREHKKDIQLFKGSPWRGGGREANGDVNGENEWNVSELKSKKKRHLKEAKMQKTASRGRDVMRQKPHENATLVPSRLLVEAAAVIICQSNGRELVMS